MRTILNFILKILIFVLIIGLLTAGIDFLRMKSGEIPIFNISEYQSRQKKQIYRGLFYVAERKVWASTSEPLTESSNMKFSLIGLEFDIPRLYEREAMDFQLEAKKVPECQGPATLFFANLDIKVYLYCLDDIKIRRNEEEKFFDSLKKDTSILDDIDSKLAYMGIMRDGLALQFDSREDDFTSIPLTMYRCQTLNVNDVYLVPKGTAFGEDFCTYKDDDFAFLFEIVDENSMDAETSTVEGENLTPVDGNEEDKKEEIIDVFYEDEKYQYILNGKKSDFIFLTTPVVRGKEAMKVPLKEALLRHLVTIDDLKEKGLSFKEKEKGK